MDIARSISCLFTETGNLFGVDFEVSSDVNLFTGDFNKEPVSGELVRDARGLRLVACYQLARGANGLAAVCCELCCITTCMSLTLFQHISINGLLESPGDVMTGVVIMWSR